MKIPVGRQTTTRAAFLLSAFNCLGGCCSKTGARGLPGKTGGRRTATFVVQIPVGLRLTATAAAVATSLAGASAGSRQTGATVRNQKAKPAIQALWRAGPGAAVVSKAVGFVCSSRRVNAAPSFFRQCTSQKGKTRNSGPRCFHVPRPERRLPSGRRLLECRPKKKDGVQACVRSKADNCRRFRIVPFPSSSYASRLPCCWSSAVSLRCGA